MRFECSTYNFRNLRIGIYNNFTDWNVAWFSQFPKLREKDERIRLRIKKRSVLTRKSLRFFFVSLFFSLYEDNIFFIINMSNIIYYILLYYITIYYYTIYYYYTILYY